MLMHATLPYLQQLHTSRQDIVGHVGRQKGRATPKAVDAKGLLDYTSQLITSTLVSSSGHGEVSYVNTNITDPTIAPVPQRCHTLRHTICTQW